MNKQNNFGDFKSSFKNKRLRYGIFSAVTTLAVIAVLVAVNFAAGRMDLKIDLTSDKLYGISDRTKEVIGAISEDVTIYTLYQTGTENIGDNIIFWEMLDQYQANSDKIKVENKDPAVYKAFTDQFSKNEQPVEQGDIIIQSGKRSKVLKQTELYSTTQDQQTGESSTQISLEYKVTNGLLYVTLDRTYTSYILTGHMEVGVSANFKTYMEDSGFDVKTLDLSTQAAVPADCDVLILTTPAIDPADESTKGMADLSKDEADKLLAYLQGGGKAMFLLDYLAIECPNLDAVMNAYGLQYGNYFILEGDSRYHHPESNLYVLPSMAAHYITNNIVAAQALAMLYAPNGISILPDRKASIAIEPLLQTSALAYGKNNPESQSANKEEDDADGPFYVAVAATDDKTKIVAVGTFTLIADQLNSVTRGVNSEFFIKSLNWLTDKPESVYVSDKSLNKEYALSYKQNEALNIRLFAMLILPVAIFGFGFFIWARRRNK